MTRGQTAHVTATMFTDEREFLCEEDVQVGGVEKIPEVMMGIGDQQVSALIDSGSEISGISEQFFNSLNRQGLKPLPSLPVPQLTIIGATKGKSKRVNRQVYLTLKLQGQDFHAACLVIPQLTRDIILGVDFMQNHNVVVNFATGSLQIGDVMVSMTKKGQLVRKQIEAMRIQIAEDVGSAKDAIQILGAAMNSDPIDIHYVAVGNRENELWEAVENCDSENVREREQLYALLDEFRDVFADEPGLTTEYVARIPVRDTTPFKQKMYPIPWAVRTEVGNQIDDMVDKGIVERSNSPFGLCKKKGWVR